METQEPVDLPVDISNQVRMIFRGETNEPKFELLNKLMSGTDVKNAKSLELELPWLGEYAAKWTKAWVEQGAFRGQKRAAKIICTEAEKNSVANVFASGVEWVDIDKVVVAPERS